jgi:hypothetical protein
MDQQIRELREFLIRVDDTALTPGDASQFCGIFRGIFKLLFQDFKNNPSLAPHGLSDEEIRKVDAVFAELSKYFSPMARSNTPPPEETSNCRAKRHRAHHAVFRTFRGSSIADYAPLPKS